MSNKKTGVELIAEERERQLNVLGYDVTAKENAHLYKNDELLSAALAYIGRTDELWPRNWQSELTLSFHRITDLKKAGALIAAEIDRLQSMEP